ncbi:uncharacterized protein [Maniola hyperantus]|uniref:uncharacterized protein n=1 Tax=Aphantopus hyperantus TaxID=2795564 RepID=UPI00374A60EB
MASNENKRSIKGNGDGKIKDKTKTDQKLSDETTTSAIANTGTDCKMVDDGGDASNAVVAPDEALNNVLTFAKQNHLRYKRNNTYCKVCDAKISSSFKRLKEHVAEQTHKDKVAGITKVVFPKVPQSEFITSKTVIEDFLMQEIVINDKFCLPLASFETIRKHGATMKCHTCEVSMHPSEVGRHIEMWQHERGKQTASVLIAFDTEFVREVRPGVYHCGFCNFIEGSIKDLKNHLSSVGHIATKGFARSRLNSHMPDIIEHRREEAFRRLVMRGMRNLFM